METYGMISFLGVTTIGPFHAQILTGLKRQTIREPRKDGRDHVKVGKAVKLYWRVRWPIRLKPIHYIGLAEVTDYKLLHLPDMWNDEKNALADGFGSLDEFRDWFYPGWREIPVLGDVVEAYEGLKGYEHAKGIIINWGRRAGKSTLIDFLEEKYYLIKWAWPLLEVGKY